MGIAALISTLLGFVGGAIPTLPHAEPPAKKGKS